MMAFTVQQKQRHFCDRIDPFEAKNVKLPPDTQH